MHSSDIGLVIAKNLKKILTEHNITQTELSTIAGVSESAVGKWILGKATPRMGAIQKIADHFNLPKSYILKEEYTDNVLPYVKLPLFGSIAAGSLSTVDSTTSEKLQYINIPRSFLGKHSTCKKLFAMVVNGDSMNKIIPNESIVVVKPIEFNQYKDGDIVVFSYNNEYSLKRYCPNDLNGFLLFKCESLDNTFKDIVVPMDTSVKLYGKVVYYGTTL